MKNLINLVFVVLLAVTNIFAQDDVLPKVFIIGEHENQFETLARDHSTMLLTVCNDDIDVAYDRWLGMLKEMEHYATYIDYDLKGVKMWLNVFYEPNGKVKHIAYYLKPNSKNVKTDELTAFFSSFMNHYTFPLVADKRYSHYGSATFPTMPKRVKVKDAQGKESGQLAKDSSNSN